jgi:hypothetical protein
LSDLPANLYKILLVRVVEDVKTDRSLTASEQSLDHVHQLWIRGQNCAHRINQEQIVVLTEFKYLTKE